LREGCGDEGEDRREAVGDAVQAHVRDIAQLAQHPAIHGGEHPVRQPNEDKRITEEHDLPGKAEVKPPRQLLANQPEAQGHRQGKRQSLAYKDPEESLLQREYQDKAERNDGQTS
jgi:hypothetical protein